MLSGFELYPRWVPLASLQRRPEKRLCSQANGYLVEVILLACVANNLNLLTDYTNGLDDAWTGFNAGYILLIL